MAEHIRVRRLEGTWSVRSGGAVLGQTQNALELSEGDLAPVVYFPRADIAMAMLDRTDKTTECPHKGVANYYSIVNMSTVDENAVWTYENPHADLAAIKDHLAFYTTDRVKVERL